LVLQSLHNLSDEQTGYLIGDRISFMRFLDLELEDAVPDATTLWLFREALVQARLIEKLFECFGQHLQAAGYICARRPDHRRHDCVVPKQRNTKDENEAIKASKTPKAGRSTRPRMPRRTRSALDEEERPELLWLQEPCRPGQDAQADPPIDGGNIVRTIGLARARFKIGR